MTFLIPLTCVTLSQFYSVIYLVLFTKNNKLWNEKKVDFFCICGCCSVHVISKEVENRVFRRNWIFRPTYFYKQPILTRQWNYNNFVHMLYSYLRYNDRLLDVFFLLLVIILSEFYENPRTENSVRKKFTQKNLSEGHHSFGSTPSFLWHFLPLFSSTLSLSSSAPPAPPPSPSVSTAVPFPLHPPS